MPRWIDGPSAKRGEKRAAIVRLEQAALEAHAAGSFEEALHVLALQARLMIGAHQAAVSYVPHGNFNAAIHTHSFSEKYEKYNTYDVMPTGEGIWSLVIESRAPVRMTEQELYSHPRFEHFSGLKDARELEHPPMPGWLAVPMASTERTFLGVLQLSDKFAGEFTADDEEQLAKLATLFAPTFELHHLNEKLQSRAVALEQRTAELEVSEARYQDLYRNAPDMFGSVDFGTGRISQCNQTLERIIGRSHQDILGRSLSDLYHPDSAKAAEAAFQALRAKGQVRDAAVQLKLADGTALDVSLNASVVQDETGRTWGRLIWRDITERRRAQVALHQKQRELERSQQELQALAARLLTALEDERRRISRELHDDVNQRLALLTFEIDTLERDLPRSRSATVARLRALREQVVTLSDDVHSLAYQFHPAILDDLGLTAALESLTDDFTRREGIEIDVTQSLREQIAPEVAYCFYRVAQEALRNVARHARAGRVTLRLEQIDDGISLVISDSGVGFEPEVTDKRRRGLGVVGMEERVRLVNGRFSVTSRIGEGTRVQAWVPVPKEVT